MKQGKIVYKGKTKKGKAIEVRLPKGDDAKDLLNYFNTLSEERTFIRFQGEQQTLRPEEKYLSDFLKKLKANEAIMLMAFINEELVGVTDIKMKDKVDSHVGVFGITVAKEYRGEGIGRLLMNLVLDEGKKNLKGIKIVSLGCFANNTGACAMYKSFGFKEYGNLPEGIKHKGKYVDHVYFYKKIR